MAVIDIGSAAIDRATNRGCDYTYIALDNPANDTGILTKMEFWFTSTGAAVKAGTFYGSETTYTNRDYEAVGDVAAGSKQTFTGLNCDVQSGDYIGTYFDWNGYIETDESGYAGVYRDYGDNFGAGEKEYILSESYTISLYGEGTTEAPPVEGTASGSGIGLASSSAKLDVFASALGNGIGLSQSSAYLEVLAVANGQGIGLGSATGEIVGIIVYGTGAGSGVGTATAQGILDVIAQAQGSGVGETTAQAILDILAEAGGSGVGLGSTEALIRVLGAAAASGEGLGSAEALLEVMAEAAGEGIGLGQSQSYIIVITTGSGSGIGTGTVYIEFVEGIGAGSGVGTASVEALVYILAEALGHGIGDGSTPRVVRIIPRIRGIKPDYTLGRVKPTPHDLGEGFGQYTLGGRMK